MKKSLSTLAAAAAVLSFMSFPQDASAEDGEKEKCYGVAAAGKNDCGTKAHSCAGMATEDADLEEWVFVPKGLCERLAGGSLTADEGGMEEMGNTSEEGL